MKNELSIYQTLERVMTNVGYIDAATGTHRCFVRDYLGNVRSVIDNSGHVLEHDGYYPYGALANAAASSVQPLKFGGKEVERRGGLNWHDFEALQRQLHHAGPQARDLLPPLALRLLRRQPRPQHRPHRKRHFGNQ